METHDHTVLVVDNNSLDRSTICASLADQGYTVLEAEGGQRALEMLHRRQSVDAVLVDLVMPGMDGFQVLSRMKADRVLRSIPVIVVSAADDMESVLRCIEKGAVAHLSKPVEREVLHSQVKATLASKQEQEAQRQGRVPGDGPEIAEEEEDQEDEEDGASLAEFSRYLLSFTEPYWKWRQIPLILFIMVVSVGVEAALPLSISFITDYALLPHDLELLILILVVVLAASIGSIALQVFNDRLYARIGNKFLNDLRFNMYRHLQRFSMGYFKRTPIGDTMSRFTTDLASVENTIMQSLPTIMGELIAMVISLGLLFYLEWRLALFSLIGLYVSYRGGAWMGPKAFSASYRAKVQQAEILAMLQEDVQGQSVVKVFRLQGMLIERFKRKMISFYRTAARASFLGYMTEQVPGQSIWLFNLVTFGAGCFLTFGGYLTVGQLLAFQVLLSGVTGSVGELTSGLPDLIQASAGMQRIKELLEEEPEVTDAPDAVALPRFSGEITLKGVKFRYGGDRLNLDDVSMTIPAQSKVAFVGPSGCGKSTVLNLLMRFYDPDEGSVCFDGIDIRGIAQNSLRNDISMVSQDTFLYDTSIRENIRMGRSDASDAAVEEAAKLAEIHHIIQAMPEGYDTLVGEGGGRLSGGQRQRVALARAIIADPALLLLDEATSALDPGTAMSVIQTLERISRGRTTIFVTHRLESARMADLVFVFDEGRLVEYGQHEQLLQDNGVYARLWHRQAGFSLDQKGDAKVEATRLRDVPFLSKLDDTILTRIAPLFVTERYAPGRVVIHEGDRGDRFYIIVRGQVEVSRRLPERVGESEQLAVKEDGDYFGQVALLRKVPRPTTMRALSDCTLLSLANEHFQRLMENAPELHEDMEQVIEEYLRSPGGEWAAPLLSRDSL